MVRGSLVHWYEKANPVSVNRVIEFFSFLPDSGGTRGLSSLFIIREILHKFEARDGLPELLLACDVFDLAGGTGTGGYAVLSFTRD